VDWPFLSSYPPSLVEESLITPPWLFFCALKSGLLSSPFCCVSVLAQMLSPDLNGFFTFFPSFLFPLSSLKRLFRDGVFASPVTFLSLHRTCATTSKTVSNCCVQFVFFFLSLSQVFDPFRSFHLGLLRWIFLDSSKGQDFYLFVVFFSEIAFPWKLLGWHSFLGMVVALLSS